MGKISPNKYFQNKFKPTTIPTYFCFMLLAAPPDKKGGTKIKQTSDLSAEEEKMAKVLKLENKGALNNPLPCLLYTSPSPRD